MKSWICLFAFVMAFSQVLAFEVDTDTEEEARFLYQNNNGMFLSLNSAYFIVAMLGVAFLAFGVLLLLGQNGNSPFASGYNRHGYDYGHYDQEHYYHDQEQHRQRRGAAFNDVASKMAQLELAFKKYQVEEAECEMYISCEASQVHRIEENGPLARIVYDILRDFNRAKDGHKWDSRIEGLVQAFEYGTNAGNADPCEPLRNKCFEVHSKKAF